MKRHPSSGLMLGKMMYSTKNALKFAGWLVIAFVALGQARAAHAVVHASILIDAQTGQVLQEFHPDEPAHPASLTKLMTLYITFQRLADGQMTLDQRLKVSRHAAAQQPSKLGLRAGTTVSVRTCILGIISHSANDAAVVLAENIGGSEAHFAQMMNQEARQLGMTHTVYDNASGLPNPRQWVTARDMATLALSIIQTFPQYYPFFDVHSFYYRGRFYYSFDHLPEEYPGADGMKTGFIDSSGFNIVTSAVRDHHRLIGVILGGTTARSRDVQMISLLNDGFGSLSHSAPLIASAVVSHPIPSRALPARVVPARMQVARSGPAHGRTVRAALARSVVGTASSKRDSVIQIGRGFRSSLEVRRVLRIARNSAPSLRHQGRALVVRLRDRRYLARFSDLSHEAAFDACTSLRARRFTCTIVQSFPGRHRELALNDRGTLALR